MTTKDKQQLLEIIKTIDVKTLDPMSDQASPKLTKWYRFGNYNALRIVCEIIEKLPVKDKVKTT